MNDNRDGSSGVEVYLPAYFRIGRDEFEFYARLPDFDLVEVFDRRLKRGKGSWMAIQRADSEGFMRVTAYCFSGL